MVRVIYLKGMIGMPVEGWTGIKKRLPLFKISMQSESGEPDNLITLTIEFVYHPHVRYLWMESEACLPAPMARMTVAEPVTMSPPAQTPFRLVFPVSCSVRI
jgi:hypothetical protein